MRARELCSLLADDCEGDNLLDMDTVNRYVVDSSAKTVVEDDWLTPVGLTWPMGFSHSAFVAQQVMTETCLQAGFVQEQFLFKDGALPDASLPSIAVATDDVNAFVRLPSHVARDKCDAGTTKWGQRWFRFWSFGLHC